VAKIFHDADFIINTDVEISIDDQVQRFCELLFGSNKISPTRYEYGMFLAKAAALSTLDLSRQVGAAIFSKTGEILTLGSNEVPRAGGGSYWCGEIFDDRDYARGYDSNDQRKRENLSDLLKRIGKTEGEIQTILNATSVLDSQLMDALEYGRMVHAEMSALADAARLGVTVKDATLYCTTYPCHMCAKHIVAVGISKVVFLEPYPKSLAIDLHADSIRTESGERGKYQNYPSVDFEHFFGISPRRYRELFERSSRKSHGQFIEYVSNVKRPIIDYTQPFYHYTETEIIQRSAEVIVKAIDELGESHSS
jgi:deoxycytidylate deaminase